MFRIRVYKYQRPKKSFDCEDTLLMNTPRKKYVFINHYNTNTFNCMIYFIT